MAKNQKKYTQEFKQQLVDLYNTGNYSYPQLSNEYGVAKSTILGWVKTLTPMKVSDTESISMKDYKGLQKKMRELEIENEILKKATAIFAKEH
ncbi:MAG: transposase [Eubacteriaceae bacterium]